MNQSFDQDIVSSSDQEIFPLNSPLHLEKSNASPKLLKNYQSPDYLPEEPQFPLTTLTTEEFYARLRKQTCDYIKSAVDLFEKAPKSPEINEQMLSLSFNLCQTFTSGFLSDTIPLNPKKEAFDQSLAQKPKRVEKVPKLKDKEKLLPERTSSQALELDYRYIFENEEFTSTGEALIRLNLEAAEQGYKFIKGTTNKKAGYSYIYCKYRLSHFEKKPDLSRKRVVCPAYYSFKKQNGSLYLIGSNLFHCHPGIDIEDLTISMKEDLGYLPKRAKVTEIVTFLESKYKVKQLNYQKVYYHFRKLKPLFGPKDCEFFHKTLIENNFIVYYDVSSTDQTLSKLLLVSPIMKKNYERYGDIVLLDSTYQTNIYKAPLAVFTGIGRDGKNILFGMAFINNESYETYKWILTKFFEVHGKHPLLFITDGDLAICKAMDDYKDEFVHFLCQWHFLRSLRRNFSFLKKENSQQFERIISLPYLKEKEEFEREANSIQEFLQNKDSYKKSLKYFLEICSEKKKWADAYKPVIFNAGTHTTSRAESMNKVIKNYVNKKSELAAMIEAIKELDNSYAFTDPFKQLPSQFQTQYQADPIMANIKKDLGELIYKRHYCEYVQSKYYTICLLHNEPSFEIDSTRTRIYEVKRDSDSSVVRIVILGETKLSCDCNLYFVEGIICRHVFCVATVTQQKDLSNYIHPRWKLDQDLARSSHDSLPDTALLNNIEESKTKEEEIEVEKKIGWKKTLWSAQKKAIDEEDLNSIGEEGEDLEALEMNILPFGEPPIQNFPQCLKTKGKNSLKPREA